MLINQADIKPILGGVQNNLSHSTLLPFINIAEQQFKKEFSVEVYNSLNESDSEAETDLQSTAKSLILWLAYSIAQPHIHVRLGDAGLAKNMPSNSVMLTKWEYVKLEESNLSMVDFFYELFYLQLDEASLQEYKDSLASKSRAKLAVSTASQFSSFFPQMAGSVRFFSKVKPYQVNVESSLRNKITLEVFNTILHPQSSDLNPDYSQLIHHASMYITHLAVYDALPFINVLISEEGIHVVVKMDGTRNELQAESTQINSLRKSLYNTAKLHLEHLLEELQLVSSPSVFPTFYDKFVKPKTDFLFIQDSKASPII